MRGPLKTKREREKDKWEREWGDEIGRETDREWGADIETDNQSDKKFWDKQTQRSEFFFEQPNWKMSKIIKK